MSNFVPNQDEGVITAPTPTCAFSGETLDNLPVPWPAFVAMIKASSEPSHASAPLIAQDTTLGQDKATVLRCWLAMGGTNDKLRRFFRARIRVNTRDESSDDMSERLGVFVEGGRVASLDREDQSLTGVALADIGALSAL